VSRGPGLKLKSSDPAVPEMEEVSTVTSKVIGPADANAAKQTNDARKSDALLLMLIDAPGIDDRREVDRGVRWILKLHADRGRLAGREGGDAGNRQIGSS
jgi:hypothetical protein